MQWENLAEISSASISVSKDDLYSLDSSIAVEAELTTFMRRIGH